MRWCRPGSVVVVLRVIVFVVVCIMTGGACGGCAVLIGGRVEERVFPLRQARSGQGLVCSDCRRLCLESPQSSGRSKW